MNKLFALADCNNFYASCERVFQPSLRHRPVVVLSNNDGCIIARSNEAKLLGIKMGTPLFKAETILRKHNVAVRSSNYALYGDLSNRVMQTLANFTPSMEIYSIDEAFLSLDEIKCDINGYCRDIKNTAYKWTGIPISIGAASTKTLAKLANNLAKKSAKANGVLALTSPNHIDIALERTPIEDIWGIGRSIATKLRQHGITNAKQLSLTDTRWIQKTLSISTVKTVLELRGQSCFELEQHPEPNKNITVSRSFGQDIHTLEHLRQSLCLYVSRAAEKLRKQGLYAQSLTAFAMSNRFDAEKAYHRSACVVFETATDSTLELIKAIDALANRIYCEDVQFKKSGVVLSLLVPHGKRQMNLFDDKQSMTRDKKLMTAIDKMNAAGKQVYFASEGIEKPWQTKFSHKSGCYTTNWDELPVVS